MDIIHRCFFGYVSHCFGPCECYVTLGFFLGMDVNFLVNVDRVLLSVDFIVLVLINLEVNVGQFQGMDIIVSGLMNLDVNVVLFMGMDVIVPGLMNLEVKVGLFSGIDIIASVCFRV